MLPVWIHRIKQSIYLFAATVLQLYLVLSLACHKASQAPAPVMTGLDRVAAGEIEWFKGRRIGIITNHTGVTQDGRHIADVFHSIAEAELVALFGPEHGIRGQAEAGAKVADTLDQKTGVPVYSLYGKTRKPTPQMLSGVTMLVFDIQDIGARFYTYISTMSLAMVAAAEQGIPFVVLDRPNPIGGHVVEGPVLDLRFRSFVGMHPIALRHGMTVGEVARMINEEGWLKNGLRADLKIVEVRGWRRDMVFSDYGKNWIAPSPNIPNFNAALLYPGMGLLEATNVSEGRGTRRPFETVGAPWMDAAAILNHLRDAPFPGLQVDTLTFTPMDLPGMATNPKYKGESCYGLRLRVTHPKTFRSVLWGFRLLTLLQANHPERFRMNQARLNRMAGQEWIYKAILQGESAEHLQQRWQQDLQAFLQIRQNYLIYP